MFKEGYKTSYHEIGARDLTYFKIGSPQGQIFFAAPDASETYRLTGTEPETNITSKESAPATSVVLDARVSPTPEPQPTSAEPSTAPRRTDSLEVAAKDVDDVIFGRPKTLWDWHVALGHLNYDDVLHLAKLPDSNVKIAGNKKRPVCQICIKAKATRRYSRGPASRSTRALGRIHIDIMGGGEVFSVLNPGSTLPKNGFTPFNYVMIITDDATRFRWVYGLLTREHEEIAEKLRQWAAHIKAQGFSMPAFYRSDNEFGSGLIMGLLTS
jgi:hypothetical protein